MIRGTMMSATGDGESVRLNLFLAQVGIGSRRACDDIIASGKVRVNGRQVRTPGLKIHPDSDDVMVDGDRVSRPDRPIVLLLHKPTGVVSTVADPEGRTTVIDLCRRYRRGRRLFPVGRLDVNTTGALLITNDGALCYQLTHPRFQTPRTYQVRVRGNCSERAIERLRRLSAGGRQRGSRGRGSIAGESVARTQGKGSSVDLVRSLGKVSVLRITLREGRNRQVRRMCEEVGLHVVKLKRMSFGPISVRGLPRGSVRPLEKNELEKLDRFLNATGG